MQRRLPLVVTGVLLLVAMSGHATAWAANALGPGGRGPYVNAPPTYVGDKPAAGAAESAAASAAAAARRPAPAPKSIAPKGSQPYSMDFTLPTLGKSGCMVCHADRNLIRIKGDQYVSYYIPDGMIEASAHGPGDKTGPAGVMCTSCHLDFASTTPHATNPNWQRTARSACISCHTVEGTDFSNGTHSVDNRPGQVDPKADQKPLCGDCHGGHDIQRLAGNPKGQAALRRDGYRVCGRCHQEQWNSYSDYYHGAAYTRGAPDAPACWDCHGAHDVLSSKDSGSPTNRENLVQTCSGGALSDADKAAGRRCHQNVNDQFVSYSGLIHRRGAILEENPLFSFIHKTQTGISAALSNIADTVRSWFT